MEEWTELHDFAVQHPGKGEAPKADNENEANRTMAYRQPKVHKRKKKNSH